MSFKSLATKIQKICRNSLGLEVAYTPTGQPEVTITGIWDGNFREVNMEAGLEVISDSPALDIVIADLVQEPQEGDAVTIEGVDFEVKEVHKDGQGMAKLMLMRL